MTLDLRPTCAALLLLALVACEDEEDIGDESCTIKVALSGDLTAELPGSDGVACATQFSGDAGIDVSFFTVTEPTIYVDLGIDLVTKGMVGSGFPAELRVKQDEMSYYATIDCTVDISDHSLVGPVDFGESWQVRGVGRCNSPAVDDAAGSVTLAPFEFATTVTWTTN